MGANVSWKVLVRDGAVTKLSYTLHIYDVLIVKKQNRAEA